MEEGDVVNSLRGSQDREFLAWLSTFLRADSDARDSEGGTC